MKTQTHPGSIDVESMQSCESEINGVKIRINNIFLNIDFFIKITKSNQNN